MGVVSFRLCRSSVYLSWVRKMGGPPGPAGHDDGYVRVKTRSPAKSCWGGLAQTLPPSICAAFGGADARVPPPDIAPNTWRALRGAPAPLGPLGVSYGRGYLLQPAPLAIKLPVTRPDSPIYSGITSGG